MRDFGAIVARSYTTGEDIIPCKLLCVPIKYRPMPSRSVEYGHIEDGSFCPFGARTHWVYAPKDLLCCDRDTAPGEVQSSASFLTDDGSVGTVHGFPAVTAILDQGGIRYEYEPAQ